ncbi:PHD finger protein 19-like [Tetranychus urticae]|uniref:PHD-type domain-containing protein n=1 Tax=Tetranychus urticae TaxID=32264 RepID=T1K5R2_TETUR|nr:PHD finger protein 19-like [Tetranychus urticae]
MSHSRNSNSVQSQTELTDEDSDDDGEQTYPRGRIGAAPNYKYGQGKVNNNKNCGDDNDDSDHDGQTDSSSDAEVSSIDSELDSFDSEDIDLDEDNNAEDDGTNDECQSDDESNCELCSQAKAKRNNSNVDQTEYASNGSASSTSTKASKLNTREITKVNTKSFGMKNVRSNQVQSYIRDSTNNVNLYPVKHWMVINKTVFVRWTNGLYYLGVIEKIEDDRGLCLIRYEDDSRYWTHFKDIHTQLSANTILSDSDIICSECRDGSSKSPNEIVICDVCNQGYHQLCHKPQIPDSVLEPDAPWTCRTCLYALGAREGGAERDTAVGEAMKLTKTVFHYDLSSLTWNDAHQSNRENIYCYCGGPGRYHSRMLQCHKCLQWFHEACIQVIDSPFLYGDHFYQFTCGVCNKGEEIVERLSMRWSDLVAIVLNNLTLRHRKRFFDLSSEIVPFVIQNNSKFKTKGYNLVKMSEDDLSQKILSVLIKYKKKFICDRDREKLTHWALRAPWPFPKPLFFAPKSYWSNCDKLKNQTNNNNHPQSISNSARSRSPPAFPLIYGACRKGAAIYPKPASMRHLVRHKERKRSRRKSQEKRKSKCLPGTSNSSNDSNDKISSHNFSIDSTKEIIGSSSSSLPDKEINVDSDKNKEHLRTKIKITTNHHRRIKIPRSELRGHLSSDVDFMNDGSSHQNVDTDNDGDDGNRDTGTDDACLEEVIPLPENFEGQNNPFFDISEQSESSTSSTSIVNSADKRAVSHSSSSRISNNNETCNFNNQHESGYQIIRSGTCSKLTLKRITGNALDKESPNKQLAKSPETETPVRVDTANESSPRKCIIKAQRLTADGKLEYLLEWE